MADYSNYTVGRLTPLPFEPPLLSPLALFQWLDPLFLARRDRRLMDWPLVKNPFANAGIVVAYLAMVYYGPKVMQNRKAFNLKRPLVIYNFGMVGLSFYMLFECLYTAYISNFSAFCQPVDYSEHPLAIRMARVVWMYFFTRYIEFFDTLFFVLRKKNNQISFLHVYHHCSIALTWWVTANVAAGGMMFPMLALNCFIHVIMYTYYGLSAIGPGMQKYLWWKVHLTKLQLIQFVCMLIFMGYNTSCDDPNFPQFINYIGVLYCSTILSLFLNFYIQAYIFKKDKGTKSEANQSKGKALSNGTYTSDKNDNHSREANGKHKPETNGHSKEANGHSSTIANGAANGKKHQ